MLSTFAAVAQPRRAVRTASSRFDSPRAECASVEHDDRDAGLDREPDVLVAEVEAVGKPVHLERDAGLERDLDHALEVERVRRAVADQAARSGG